MTVGRKAGMTEGRQESQEVGMTGFGRLLLIYDRGQDIYLN